LCTWLRKYDTKQKKRKKEKETNLVMAAQKERTKQRKCNKKYHEKNMSSYLSFFRITQCNAYLTTHTRPHPCRHTYANPTPMSTSEELSTWQIWR
jgi:hypothetical protein